MILHVVSVETDTSSYVASIHCTAEDAFAAMKALGARRSRVDRIDVDDECLRSALRVPVALRR